MSTPTGRIHVAEARGRGHLPPLVLLHGFTSAGAHYAPLALHLLPHVRRMVLPDMPAHGLSDAPTSSATADAIADSVGAALDATLHEPAVVFGNSLGGLAALRYAIRRPERVRGLFLCSPAGAPLPQDEARRIARMFRGRSHRDAAAFMDQVMAAPWLWRHALAWGFRARLRRPGIQALVDRVDGTPPIAPEDLARLRMPVKLFWGGRDRLLPRSGLHYFRTHLPSHTEVEEPPNLGHSPYLEDAAAVASSIARFSRHALLASPVMGPGLLAP